MSGIRQTGKGSLRMSWHGECRTPHGTSSCPRLAKGQLRPGSPYWLVPFNNYKTFCPYLVGSYDEVSCEVSKYIQEGFRTFILDVPPSREELHHTAMVF